MDIPLLFGPYGSAALQHAQNFEKHGANAAWFHMFDPEAFEICARHNVAPCVEFKTFRADFNEHPELIPIGVDGKPIRYARLVQGVCLSQQAFLDETEGKLLAGLRTFKPTGIWLDYLTYGGWFETPEPDLQESCFCPACIDEFCQATGIDADSPAVILRQHQDAWTRHKSQRVAHYAKRYADLIRSYLPGCIIGAYMCPWSPDEFDGALSRIFAQDYDLLAPAIDVFTPLIYAHKSGRQAAWAKEVLESTSALVYADHKVQLILDALDYPDSLLAIVDASPTSWGIQIFGGANVFADPAKAGVFQEAVSAMRSKLE
jgi:hypothetical protein